MANIYAPNTDQARFLSSTLTRLASFGGPCVIVGGDFNVALSPSADTSTGKSSITTTSLSHIRSLLHSHHLVDVWRIHHPTDRDFTYFSIAHNSYSRLDYFLISQSLLDTPLQTSLGHALWSDHSPVYLSFAQPPQSRTGNSWRLNDNLLRDSVCVAEVTKAIQNLRSDRIADTTSPLNQWEALKCVVRGVLIQNGSRLMTLGAL